MVRSNDLTRVLDRVATAEASAADYVRLGTWTDVRGDGAAVQVGHHNINLRSERDIHIGDRIYAGADARMIRAALVDVASPGRIPRGSLRGLGGFVSTIGALVALAGMALFFYGLVQAMTGPTPDGPPIIALQGFGIAFAGVIIGALGGLITGWQRPSDL